MLYNIVSIIGASFFTVFPFFLLPCCLFNKLFNYLPNTWDIGYYVCYNLLLRTKHSIKGKFIDKGFILANHRTFFDLIYDPYISNTSIIGRTLAFQVMFFNTIILMLENRCIIIDRNNSRQVIFQKIQNFMNSNSHYKNKILFWPEGTRKNYVSLTLEETKLIIKPGLLKSIYEYNKLPVQLMLSKNKEKVVNEKKLLIGFGETVYTQLSQPIYPENYKTFEEFLDKIHNEWFSIFSNLYCSDNDKKLN